MPYFHVRLYVIGQRREEVKSDLDEEGLEKQFLEPYRRGTPITVNGKTIPLDNLDRIRITTSEKPIAVLIEAVKAAARNSNVVSVGGPTYESRAAARARDVTDQFVTGPPGALAASSRTRTSVTPTADAEAVGEPNTVFVVAGRDSKAAASVTALLRALQLSVIEWEHAVALTGLPNPYVGDVVLEGLRRAAVAVVVITPDDLVRLRDDLLRDDDDADEREFRGQARPNVYYEAGIADALGRHRTVIVEIGNVKSFSDAAGRHVVRYDGSPSKRNSFVERLKLAGVDPQTTGGDWLSAGDLTSVLAAAKAALESPSDTNETVIDKARATNQVNDLLDLVDNLRRRSAHDDLSDLPDESLEFVVRAQSLVDRLAAETSYLAEVAAVKSHPAHIRLPVLVAVLKGLRADLLS